MSPLGKPDGGNPRHYGGGHGSLGRLTVWDCPACGLKNEGRGVEQGCVHCGAGDPTTSKAGQPVSVESRVDSSTESGDSTPRAPNAGPRRTESSQPSTAPIRIYRLIEYQIWPGVDYQDMLRRSLVGSIERAWGTITATIVDTLDPQQEDRLRMARMQPGVWLANPEAMHARPQVGKIDVSGYVNFPATGELISTRSPLLDYLRTHPGAGVTSPVTPTKETQMEMPDTGPEFSADERRLAEVIRGGGTHFAGDAQGYRLVNTLALALGSIAEELTGNAEPEKFLSREECLSLANALLHQIPADWRGEGVDVPVVEMTPQPTYTAEAIDRIRAGSQPVATYTEPEDRRGGGR